jgi:transposase
MSHETFNSNKQSSDEGSLVINGGKDRRRAWIGLRIAGLLLILTGWKSTAVAKLFNLSRPSVISWIKKANEEGLGSVEDKTRSGRPGKLDEEVAKTLKEALSRSPEEYGINRFRWDGIVVVEFLKKSLSISLKPRQARNWLHKLGYVRKRPVHQYIQASEEGVEKFRQGVKKTSRESKGV